MARKVGVIKYGIYCVCGPENNWNSVGRRRRPTRNKASRSSSVKSCTESRGSTEFLKSLDRLKYLIQNYEANLFFCCGLLKAGFEILLPSLVLSSSLDRLSEVDVRRFGSDVRLFIVLLRLNLWETRFPLECSNISDLLRVLKAPSIFVKNVCWQKCFFGDFNDQNRHQHLKLNPTQYEAVEIRFFKVEFFKTFSSTLITIILIIGAWGGIYMRRRVINSCTQ